MTISSIVLEFIDNYLKDLALEKARIKKMLAVVKKLPIEKFKNAFPNAIFIRNYSSVGIMLPMSYSLIQEVRIFMETTCPEFEKNSDMQYVFGNSATHYIEYALKKNANIKFEVRFPSSVKGSTCVLNPIGTEMVEKITYEVVCSEAAAEEFSINK